MRKTDAESLKNFGKLLQEFDYNRNDLESTIYFITLVETELFHIRIHLIRDNQ